MATRTNSDNFLDQNADNWDRAWVWIRWGGGQSTSSYHDKLPACYISQCCYRCYGPLLRHHHEIPAYPLSNEHP